MMKNYLFGYHDFHCAHAAVGVTGNYHIEAAERFVAHHAIGVVVLDCGGGTWEWDVVKTGNMQDKWLVFPCTNDDTPPRFPLGTRGNWQSNDGQEL